MVRSRRNRKVHKHNRTHKLIRIHRRLTDYPRRLALLRGAHPYLTITASNRQYHILGFEGVEHPDRIAFAVGSSALRRFGYQENLVSRRALYLLGYLFGRRFLDRGDPDRPYMINFGILRSPARGRLYAVVRGIYDSGFPLRVSDSNFPSDELISNADPMNWTLVESYRAMIDSIHSATDLIEEHESSEEPAEGLVQSEPVSGRLDEIEASEQSSTKVIKPRKRTVHKTVSVEPEGSI